ncbi:Sphingolipid hydroxylase [Phaffia rhodozyma]|uniref:Sphingolipid hydroxylase n=1 Tax=Phaffia rhodozyma TaxID=264483 RepID=A0A0F7SPL6_PHARH|nr:Sphingolipid hydroxylase [Phaffia rhodozyma]
MSTGILSYLIPSFPVNSNLTASLLPQDVHYPIYLAQRDSLLPFVSDRYLAVLTPVVVYWIVGGLFYFLDEAQFEYFEKRRIHESEEVTRRNRVSFADLIKAVVLQHVLQTILGLFWLSSDEEILRTQIRINHLEAMQSYAPWVGKAVSVLLGPKNAADFLGLAGGEVGRGLVEWNYWWGVPIFQFGLAFFIIDTHQFFLHKTMHEVPYLYRNFHSHHHRLYVPYAFGALYNHWLEGLLLDSVGAAMAEWLSGMTVRQTILLFGFSSAKTVDDHSGYRLWWDPMQMLFANNADYHDIHHQSFGIKKNFSQPFFTRWDHLFDTVMTREEVINRKRVGGVSEEEAIREVEKQYKLD